MLKKVSFVLESFFFVLLLFSFASAVPQNSLGEDVSQLVGTSDKNIRYDKDILDNFNFTEEDKYNFVKGDFKKIPEKEFGGVYVMVDIKDITNITIPNRNSPDFESMLQERNEILIKQTNAVLNTLSDEEFQLKTNSEFGGFFSGNITKDGFEKLLHDERVGHIYSKKYGGISLAESTDLINADNVWNDYDGAGQTVCVIDTGIDYDNAYLSGNYLGGYDYVNGDSDPMDDDGHGTHVAGIIASTHSTQKGIANGAGIVALKALNEEGDIDQDAVGSSLQWCLNNAGTYDISVVSMSFGSLSLFTQCDYSWADDELEDLYNAGITLVASSGNNEDPSHIDYPSCNENVISVGAVYDDNIGSQTHCTAKLGEVCLFTCTDETTDADQITCFTNRGTLLDLLAPGCEITSTTEWMGNDVFLPFCGTSQAAPHVAGAAALLLEKDPSLTPDEIKSILQNTGVSVGSWKRIDVEAALESIETPCSCSSWSFSGSCGTGGCSASQKPQTRSCTPDACQSESQCVYDESCVEEESEVNDCTESGYEFCIAYSYGDCDVSIASNLYENVNNFRWGAVNDAWDPYVIGSYFIGWKGVDTEQMYYGCDGENDCEYGGCDCDEIDREDTMTTINAPGIAYTDGILGYEDTDESACWVWWSSFYPNYGEDNPIYVLRCFIDGDCSSGQYCDKSGDWDDWSCINLKSNGQSCTSDSQCSSGYCDNDGLGLGDDSWCFIPYNTYFDGQENTKCDISTGYGISDCDERQVGEDLNKCVGVAFYEDECSSSCASIDVTSIFECGETGCSCSQPLCDGLTEGNNITSCYGGETYFADNCTASAEGQDRDTICRSSSFATGCTADAACNGIIAGTGNCTSSCEYSIGSQGNYSSNSTYYKKINITELSGETLTNYSVQIYNFNCNNNCNNSGKDIRVVYNNKTNLQFGLQKVNDSFYNLVFRINLPARGFNDSIYVYYGDMQADYVNSSWNSIMYNIYDDFSTNTLNTNWICVDNSCSYNSVSKRMDLNSGGSYNSAILTYNLSSFDDVFVEVDVIQENIYLSGGWLAIESATTKTSSSGLLTRSSAITDTGFLWLYNGSSTTSNVKLNGNWQTLNSLNATYSNLSASSTRLAVSGFNGTATLNSTLVSDNIYLRFHARDVNLEIDNFRVRNYTYPEPTYTISNQFNSSNGSSGTWWNSNWQRKKAINIQERSGKSQVNYSVLIYVPYDADMQADFDDLRFTNRSENIELKYYVESKSDSNYAYVWVLIPNLAPSSNTTIYMYYKNSSVSSNSNRNNAFLLFEDFSTNPFSSRWNCWDATCSYDSGNQRVSLSAGSGFASAVMSYFKSAFSNVEIKYTESGLSSSYWFATEIRSAQNGSGAILSRYFGYSTPAIQIDAGTTWKVSSSFSSASNFTNAWYNFSSSITTQNITSKNETRLQNTSVGLDNSYVNLHGRTASTIVIDDVRIRRYTLPEPIYYLGNEQSYS